MNKLKALFKTRQGRKMLTIAGVTIGIPVLATTYVLTSNNFIDIDESAQTTPTIDTTNKTKASVQYAVEQVVGGWFAPKDASGSEDDEETGQVDNAAQANNAPASEYDPSSAPATPPPVANEEVYAKLSQNPAYANKAAILATTYSLLESVYGENFTIGVMANVYAEGTEGVIEYRKTVPNWDGDGIDKTSYSNSPLIVRSRANAQACVDLGGGVSVGLGRCQWSFDRRVNLAKHYLESCSSYSAEDLSAREDEFMLSEFQGGYKNVVDMSVGANASDCAWNVCMYYERPSHKEAKAAERRTYADDIYSILHQ